ncbi:MAG: pirin family protein [Steroidobacteraceae bacterium]
MERIAAHAAEIGAGFTIRRALPTRRRRLVGAWCFLDHLGPAQYAAGQGLHVGPHPHIGLQTFTWVIEGEILHRDSLGYEQIIRPGQVNLMTAGRGISHAEDAPGEDAGRIHAAQLWIALPDEVRHCEPAFDHYPELPVTTTGGFRITVLAGELLGELAPARIHSPLVGADLQAAEAAATLLALRADFEYAVLVLAGTVNVAGAALQSGTLLYLSPGRGQLQLACDAGCRLLLIGGAPFREEVLLWWNFVARDVAEIEAATADWNQHHERFGTVRGSPAPLLVAPDVAQLRLRGKPPK